MLTHKRPQIEPDFPAPESRVLLYIATGKSHAAPHMEQCGFVVEAVTQKDIMELRIA